MARRLDRFPLAAQNQMGPRWKTKNFAAIAESNPLSKIIQQLQSALRLSHSKALLSGCDVLFEATPEIADLLNRSSFGREINTCEKGKQWFQLGLEEAFYLHHKLEALSIVTERDRTLSQLELWVYMKSKAPTFPEHYKAYAHLRTKNWVVRSGTQYGGDFVAYRHHPALVHSEYLVIVILERDDSNERNARLRVWSDLQCGLRVSGSVAKTLLVVSVNKNGSDVNLPSCLEGFTVEESTIERWVGEQCREESCSDKEKNSSEME